MKTIGRTTEGLAFVEMTQQEYELFCALARVVEGEVVDSWNFSELHAQSTGYDLSNALDAVRAYVETTGLVNMLHNQVGSVRQSLMRKNEKKHGPDQA